MIRHTFWFVYVWLVPLASSKTNSCRYPPQMDVSLCLLLLAAWPKSLLTDKESSKTLESLSKEGIPIISNFWNIKAIASGTGNRTGDQESF
jgi:hypothetical protein